MRYFLPKGMFAFLEKGFMQYFVKGSTENDSLMSSIDFSLQSIQNFRVFEELLVVFARTRYYYFAKCSPLSHVGTSRRVSTTLFRKIIDAECFHGRFPLVCIVYIIRRLSIFVDLWKYFFSNGAFCHYSGFFCVF